MTARSLFATLGTISLMLCYTANAQENTSPEEEVPFGTYGYRHHELHEKGIIDELMALTDSNCCDGGHGGECRVTRIRSVGVRWEFLHDETWCPLDPDVDLRFDILLPNDVGAVVCASQSESGECPATYCAAVETGS